MQSLLSALNSLHRSQLIHRDIKPANILVFDDSSVKICDFGLARSIKNLKLTSEDIMRKYDEKSNLSQLLDNNKKASYDY